MLPEDIKPGMKFGHLTVVDYRERGKRRKSFLCQCDCGEFVVKGAHQLLGNKSRRPDKSCGCSQYAHNGRVMDHKREYGIWHQMISRCYDKTADNYDRYGGKGVTVCDEWRESFDNFLDWALNNGYADNLTLDRIDHEKPYSPENCRWVDYYVQNQNKGLSKNNTTGVKGVSYFKKQKLYRAYIMRNGIRLDLGSYKTLEEARDIRQKAEDYFKENKTLEGFKVI